MREVKREKEGKKEAENLKGRSNNNYALLYKKNQTGKVL